MIERPRVKPLAIATNTPKPIKPPAPHQLPTSSIWMQGSPSRDATHYHDGTIHYHERPRTIDPKTTYPNTIPTSTSPCKLTSPSIDLDDLQAISRSSTMQLHRPTAQRRHNTTTLISCNAAPSDYAQLTMRDNYSPPTPRYTLKDIQALKESIRAMIQEFNSQHPDLGLTTTTTTIPPLQQIPCNETTDQTLPRNNTQSQTTQPHTTNPPIATPPTIAPESATAIPPRPCDSMPPTSNKSTTAAFAPNMPIPITLSNHRNHTNTRNLATSTEQRMLPGPKPATADHFNLVFQAADRLDDAIANMSAAIAAVSASIATLPPSKPPFDSHQPLRRLPLPPIDPQQPTFPPCSPRTSLSRHRSRSILPLPSTHPPFTRKTTLANM